MKRYTVTRYSLDLSARGRSAGRCRIVFFSDMHSCCEGDEGKTLRSLIEDAAPDIILCGGDAVVAAYREKSRDVAGFLTGLTDIAPMIMGIGNHEQRYRYYTQGLDSAEGRPGYDDYMRMLTDGGIRCLSDESVSVQAGGVTLTVYGYDMPDRYYVRFRRCPVPAGEFDRVFGRPSESSVSILLAHHPKTLGEAARWGADITFCGHYHGGIIRLAGHTGLVSPELFPFPRNAYGHFQNNGKHGIITSGCGEHTVPFRLHNRREIVVTDLQVGNHGDPR